MTAVPGTAERLSVRTVELRQRSELLFWVAASHVALAVIFTVLIAVDGRILLGRNVWAKPLKFAVSIAIFTATVAWLLPSLSLDARTERFVSRTIAVAMVVEILLITTQATRGVPSHFNFSTVLDGTIFIVMGTTITLSTFVVAYLLVETVRQPPDIAPAYLWGIRFGILVFVVASLEGGLMAALGSHSIGVESGSPGIPLLNWKTNGGDLRVAHFVGLHALQVLPLTGYLSARSRGISSRASLGIVGVSTVLYGGLTLLLFFKAVRGVPVISSLP